jgi:vacuolar protein-sorting-associated protein 4
LAFYYSNYLGDTPHNLLEKDFEDLAIKTCGFIGLDVTVVVSHGTILHVLQNVMHFK